MVFKGFHENPVRTLWKVVQMKLFPEFIAKFLWKPNENIYKRDKNKDFSQVFLQNLMKTSTKQEKLKGFH